MEITKGKYVIGINGKEGWFEHDTNEFKCGGLWFFNKELSDYDGVTILPKDVISGIEELGYIVGKEFIFEGEND